MYVLNLYFTDCNALLSEDCVNKSKCGHGYYGPNCDQQCNCTQFQLCDSVKGCINNSETGVTTSMYNKNWERIFVGVYCVQGVMKVLEKEISTIYWTYSYLGFVNNALSI